MQIQLLNGYYFLYIGIAIFLLVGLYVVLRHRTDAYLILQIIAFLNLGIHFCKLLIEPYRSGLPDTLRKVTPENICAVSTLLLPFVLMLKDGKIKNYFFFISFIGGCAAMFYPMEALGKEAFALDTIRFYICHMILFFIPVLATLLGYFQFSYDWKAILSVPILFLVVECIILANEYVLRWIGFVNPDWSIFYNRMDRNSSFIFGPLPALDDIYQVIMDVMVPRCFKTDYFGITKDGVFYFPVFWMTLPVFVYFPILYTIVYGIFRLLSRLGDVKDSVLKKRESKSKRMHFDSNHVER